METNKNITVVAVISIAILAVLGFWWASSGASLGNLSGNAPVATSTPATSTPTGGTASTRVVATKSQDVSSIVAGLSGASIFKDYFSSTGVAATVRASSTAKYTIFVPTDASISRLKTGTISGLSAAEKKRFVQHHIIMGRAVDVDSQVAGQVQALSGDMLNFNFGSSTLGEPMVNSSSVVAQYNGTNGIVYVIDNVLLPPKKTN